MKLGFISRDGSILFLATPHSFTRRKLFLDSQSQGIQRTSHCTSHYPANSCRRGSKTKSFLPKNLTFKHLYKARVWGRFIQEHRLKKPSDVQEHLIEIPPKLCLALPNLYQILSVRSTSVIFSFEKVSAKQKKKKRPSRFSPCSLIWDVC